MSAGKAALPVRGEADLKTTYDELVARMVAELSITQPPSPLL